MKERTSCIQCLSSLFGKQDTGSYILSMKGKLYGSDEGVETSNKVSSKGNSLKPSCFYFRETNRIFFLHGGL